ncbi:acyl-CoA dehydrogenase [Rhodopseudomonas boonkerdii]|uniref:acyl-CoA dehydrogenase family protein n=1 Tax=Rhodopseudomonas boonkerdii TaxID=475937 RepID=UPI001E4ADD2E|nr:acyl-CoA dehydrogenase family protein [Rhodopseudomonas boonkerdii]UGV28617.1 acyl-CoA dehydrogenase [Rhodopseudomonas boonkerdii]UGV28656.1 acyl-CoA dehydrogenase [Rhodopseudomonas boonkerdii]
MEFGLSNEQQLLESSLRRFLEGELSIERLRKVAGIGTGFDAALWEGLVGQGIVGFLVPEHFGGTGLALLDAAVVAESLGYHVTPLPFLASVVMAPLTLMSFGSEAQQAEWLPKIASGEVKMSMAFVDGAGQTGCNSAWLKGNMLSGHLTGVLDAGAASHVLVLLTDGRAALVDAHDTGVTVDVHASIDRTRPISSYAFSGAKAIILDAAADAHEAATRVIDAGRLVLAADTLGAAQFMFDRALDYSKERVQFDRAIGSFQAVKHTIADLATMLEPCRALVWYAAYAQDALPEEARIMALHAKAHVSEVGREVARLTTELHGGMGFTDLLGLHYWFKRIAFDRQILGAPEYCRREAAKVQGWLVA